jgi:hypothetical protein
MPVPDAKGEMIEYGDYIMHGMRRGDPKGWGEVIVVAAKTTDEVLGMDPETGECEELNGNPRLRGLIYKSQDPRCPRMPADA